MVLLGRGVCATMGVHYNTAFFHLLHLLSSISALVSVSITVTVTRDCRLSLVDSPPSNTPICLFFSRPLTAPPPLSLSQVPPVGRAGIHEQEETYECHHARFADEQAHPLVQGRRQRHLQQASEGVHRR